MSRLSFHRKPDFLSNLSAVTFLVILAAVLYFSPQRQALEALNFDLLTVISADEKPDQALVIIGIDDQSFANLNVQWPWPRGVHAHLLEQVKKQSPRAIVFDLLFSEPSEPSEDELLAQAIIGETPVVMASERAFQQTEYAQIVTDVLPLPSFLASGAIPGDVGIQNDPDQAVRLLPGQESAMWRKTLEAIASDNKLELPNSSDSANRYIKYVGSRGTIPTISYYQALFADEFLPSDFFTDKIVLIGFTMLTSPTAKGKGDNHATPFTLLAGEFTPGVEIHASAINSQLQSIIIEEIDPLYEALGTLIAVSISLVIFSQYSLVAGGVLLILVSGLMFLASFFAFSKAYVFGPVLAPIVIMVAGFFTFTLVRYLREQKKSREIRQAFEHYVPADVVGELVLDPGQIKLGGDRKHITVMFTDLAGFTSLAEKTEAEELSSILNDHLNRMTKIILRNGGTLDKFIGDAIMAFWGAPIAEPEQADKAIHCAVEMQKEMQKFRSEYELKGKPPLFMRVGLNTCEAIVGNMGGEDRFDYTAIGDGVNLAARLEGANKAYGTEILISQNTLDESNSDSKFCLLDQIRVKGKKQAIEIYTIASSDRAQILCSNFMSKYKDCLWREALKILNEISEIPDLSNYADGMKLRVKELETNEVKKWDGVSDLEKL